MNTVEIKAIKAPVDEITFTPVVFENEDSHLKLAGIVFEPRNKKEGEKLPAVVVQGPMGATKEQTQSLYASCLAAQNGYITMVYDYSYLGSSQGVPRGYEDPQVKISDIRSAITFLSNYEGVDSERIAAVGICGSGVYLVGAAVKETRLKAAVSVNPFTVINTVPYDAEQVKKDKESFEKTGVTDRLDLIEPGSEGAEYYFNHKRGAAVNRVPFVSWSEPEWAAYNPTEIAKNLNTPYLLVIGENAFTRPGAEVMFDGVPAKDKKKVVIPGARHFDMYDGEGFADKSINAISEFLKERL